MLQQIRKLLSVIKPLFESAGTLIWRSSLVVKPAVKVCTETDEQRIAHDIALPEAAGRNARLMHRDSVAAGNSCAQLLQLPLACMDAVNQVYGIGVT